MKIHTDRPSMPVQDASVNIIGNLAYPHGPHESYKPYKPHEPHKPHGTREEKLRNKVSKSKVYIRYGQENPLFVRF